MKEPTISLLVNQQQQRDGDAATSLAFVCIPIALHHSARAERYYLNSRFSSAAYKDAINN